MLFPDNTPNINEVINLPVGEIALLPVDLLAALQHEIDAAAKQMKVVTTRFNTALEVRFATRAAEVRSATG
jgi:serine kinase of HPr protein (carbohydrate metabolism regulator)